MSPRRPPRAHRSRESWRVPLVILVLLAFSVVVGLTAANVVGSSRASDTRTPVSIPDSPPAECSEITTTSTISGTGIIAGTLDNDWIVGSESPDTIDGLAGDDCIEGKGSDDVIDGGLGTDVCLGGGGNDTFVACETEIQ